MASSQPAGFQTNNNASDRHHRQQPDRRREDRPPSYDQSDIVVIRGLPDNAPDAPMNHRSSRHVTSSTAAPSLISQPSASPLTTNTSSSQYHRHTVVNNQFNHHHNGGSSHHGSDHSEEYIQVGLHTVRGISVGVQYGSPPPPPISPPISDLGICIPGAQVYPASVADLAVPIGVLEGRINSSSVSGVILSEDYAFGTPLSSAAGTLKLTGRPRSFRGSRTGRHQYHPHYDVVTSANHALAARDETTKEGHNEDDEATLRELLVSLQKQVTVMSMNLSAKLDELQRGDRQLETTVALCEIRSQLQELTKSVESCQSEVSEVKRDMVAIKHELDTVQQVKEEIEELREYVDRLEEHSHRRKLRLLEQGLTFFLSYAILAAVLGMLQFGYNTGVINAPEQNIENFMKDVYKDRYGEDATEDTVKYLYSIAVSIFAIGGMLGGFIGGMVANRFGRKGGLLINNVLGIGGAFLMGFTKVSYTYELLFVGRFIIGVNCGLNTSLVPMYVSEIAPLNLRGGLGTVNQLAVTVGLLLSQVLGIEQILGTDDGWPVLLGLAICPAILQLILLPVCPESPRYLLITKQWEEEARKALRRLRASNQVEEDIEEMRAEERAQQTESSMSTMQLICSPTLRSPLIIGVVMQLSQQLSGINAVFYYSTSLFTSSGLTEESAKFATIGIGAIMVLMTLVSIPLMDRTGRRTLHLYGLGGMFIFSIFITISFLIKEMIDWMSYLSVVSTLGFVVFFAVGPGSIPWMITAELFSQGPRPSAMAIAVLVNWSANFVVGIGFPSMKTALENYTFLPFSVLLAIFWIFTYKKVPETKNKTFEEILALFRSGNGRSMLNCVNALEPLPAGTGTEQAALMVTEEKSQPDSYGTVTPRRSPHERRRLASTYNPRRHSAYATVSSAASEHSSREDRNNRAHPPPLPPPRFPNSGV